MYTIEDLNKIIITEELSDEEIQEYLFFLNNRISDKNTVENK